MKEILVVISIGILCMKNCTYLYDKILKGASAEFLAISSRYKPAFRTWLEF